MRAEPCPAPPVVPRSECLSGATRRLPLCPPGRPRVWEDQAPLVCRPAPPLAGGQAPHAARGSCGPSRGNISGGVCCLPALLSHGVPTLSVTVLSSILRPPSPARSVFFLGLSFRERVPFTSASVTASSHPVSSRHLGGFHCSAIVTGAFLPQAPCFHVQERPGGTHPGTQVRGCRPSSQTGRRFSKWLALCPCPGRS